MRRGFDCLAEQAHILALLAHILRDQARKGIEGRCNLFAGEFGEFGGPGEDFTFGGEFCGHV